tara:strand:- start:1270 stop:2403 length:1134 start_codon:yes stop_codon:yes gene_type:complete
MFKLKDSKIFFYIFLYIIISPLFFPLKTISNSVDPNEFQYSKNYVMGIGDGILIKFDGVPVYTGVYYVQTDGYLNLPELGLVLAKSKTLEELQKNLLDQYSEFIVDPKIDLSVYSYRPVTVTVNGEVNRPGLYTIKYGIDNNQNQTPNLINDNLLKSPFSSTQSTQNQPVNQPAIQMPPKLFDLIIASDGLTPNANISQIKIIRKNPESNGGGKLIAKIDLISLLNEGDQKQNISLLDGDHIFIPKSEKLILNQLIDINRSNLSPGEIEVFVNGNVSSKGRLLIRQGLSLHEAIAAAGGENNLTGNIEFIRLTNNGRTNKRIISFKKSAKKGSRDNPILLAGDIIYVRRNIVGKFGSIITDYTSPLINAYGIYKIFE